jgi:nucleotide-binding universal stress UspA family protein
MFRHVLLCYDGSDAGRRALKRGAELAILVNAQVHVLSIISDAVADAALLARATGHVCLVEDARGYRKMLDESIDWLASRGVAAEGHLVRGDTMDQIVTYSKNLDIDLIVLGHYPRPSGGRWWSGSQRTALAERVDCCVFIAVAASENPLTS